MFTQTVDVINASDADAVAANVSSEVNSFLETISPPTDVLAVEYRGFPAGKYEQFYSYVGVVTYLTTI